MINFKYISMILALLSGCTMSDNRLHKGCQDTLQFDYVDLYSTTPFSIGLDRFYSYFYPSIETTIVKEQKTISKFELYMKDLVEKSCKYIRQPDIRIVVYANVDGKIDTVTMGSSLVRFKGENYAMTDTLIEYLSEVTGNDW